MTTTEKAVQEDFIILEKKKKINKSYNMNCVHRMLNKYLKSSNTLSKQFQILIFKWILFSHIPKINSQENMVTPIPLAYCNIH